MVASDTRHAFIPSARRTVRSAARFWTARAKVFMDLGFDGASMNEIARAAGVSKGTLYVYFADKSRLFEAIVEDEALEKSRDRIQSRSRARCRNHAAGIRPGLHRMICAGRAADRRSAP